MNFEFYTAPKVVFGCGQIKRLPELCRDLGSHFLIVTGGGSLERSGALGTVINGLESAGKKVTLHSGVTDEPTLKTVDEAVSAGRKAGIDAVIGIGGGSVMDTAKAAAGVIPNSGSVKDYLEDVGMGAKLAADPLPFIAVPTTAGTGTEVTKNAVIMSREERFKKSMRDERLIADAVIADPELTLFLPKDVTAACGMDAICQLIESFTSRGANDICDALSIYHIPKAIMALKEAYDDGSNFEARTVMSLASMISGICLANAGLGAAHGIAAALGAELGIKHGVACGMLLPYVMRYNIAHGVTKYADIARAIGCSDEDDKTASVYAAYEIGTLCEHLGLPKKLSELGVKKEMAAVLAKASMGSSMSKNPVEMGEHECAKFIESII